MMADMISMMILTLHFIQGMNGSIGLECQLIPMELNGLVRMEILHRDGLQMVLLLLDF